MIRIILKEADRDRRVIIFCLLFFPALFVASRFFEEQRETFEIFSSIVALIFVFPLPFVFAGLAFRVQRSDQSHEYYLSLNLERWKVWLAKLLYLIIIVLAIDVVIFLFIGAMSFRENSFFHELFRFLSSYPKDLLLYYYLLGLCALSLFGALPRLDRPGLMLTMGTIGVGGILLYESFKDELDSVFFTDHQLYLLPWGAGVMVLLISISSLLYSRYRLDRRTILKLSGIFVGASLCLLGLQWTYSTAMLSSDRAKERARAISVFRAVNPDKAVESLDEAINSFQSLEDLNAIRKTMLNHQSIMEKMRETWRRGALADKWQLRLISLECAASLGRDPELAKKILRRLESDDRYRRELSPEDWADAIALLTPREGLHDLIFHLLSSDLRGIREIGYRMTVYYPADDYVPLIIQAARAKEAGREVLLGCSSVSIISTGFISCHSNRSLNQLTDEQWIEQATAKWEQWYNQRLDQTFAARAERRLSEIGIDGSLDSMSSPELMVLYNSYLSRESDLNDVIDKMIQHRLNIILLSDLRYTMIWWETAEQKLGLTHEEISRLTMILQKKASEKKNSPSP